MSKKVLTEEAIKFAMGNRLGNLNSNFSNVAIVPQTSNVVSANIFKNPRKIEFVSAQQEEPIYFDKEPLRNFRQNITKNNKNFEIFWKNNEHTLNIVSTHTGNVILELNYETHETFLSNECRYSTKDMEEKVKQFDPLDKISSGGSIPTFINQLKRYQSSISTKQIVKENSNLILKNYFAALYIEDQDFDNIETLRQDALDDYTNTVSHYLTHLANVSFNGDTIKHAVKNINLDDIRSTTTWIALYTKLHVLSNAVTYTELEYAKILLEKHQKVLKQLKKTYKVWLPKLKDTYLKQEIDDSKIIYRGKKVPYYINGTKNKIEKQDRLVQLKVKDDCLDKFKDKNKWFGFKKNSMLRNFFKVFDLDSDIVIEFENLSSLKTTQDILTVHNVLLCICSVTKSKQIIAFANCIEEINENHFINSLKKVKCEKDLSYITKNNNLLFFDSLLDLKTRGYNNIMKLSQCLDKKFHYPSFLTYNYLANSVTFLLK